jgi:signal transduction histidine kinase
MQSEKILVVDDNVDNVDLLSKRFRSLGYTVDEAFDGQEALDRVAVSIPDLIILDIMMPRLDGFEVCQRLKAKPETRLIPIIMLTAKRELPDKIKGLDTGADDYVTKPFNPRELVARAKSLLQRRSSEQRKATEDKLGALGQMAEGVAHEVRNPMVSIGGFARRIHQQLPEGDPLKEYASHIIKEVERLETMIEEIVRFKSLMITPYQPVELSQLMKEIMYCWVPEFKKGDITWSVEPQGQTFDIIGDLNNLKLAFSNVIQNSFESLKPGGNISITMAAVEDGTDRVSIIFVDDGEGISKADLPNVFDPFFTSKMSGPGMGLTIVHRIVSRHGGDVEITSTPGMGTKVTIHLPRKQEKFI